MQELLKKINAIQSELSVKKDGTNPYYKSKYMTLDNIMEQLQPLLDREGLMIYNYNTEGGVKTIVTDFTDNVYSEFKIQGVQDPQAMGKVITYGRRYNLVSIFNILADEDDDAQSYYETKGQKTEKYTKKQFGLKELDNLKLKKDMYSYDEAVEMIKKNYSIDTEMELKVMDLYGIEGKDLF